MGGDHPRGPGRGSRQAAPAKKAKTIRHDRTFVGITSSPEPMRGFTSTTRATERDTLPQRLMVRASHSLERARVQSPPQRRSSTRACQRDASSASLRSMRSFATFSRSRSDPQDSGRSRSTLRRRGPTVRPNSATKRRHYGPPLRTRRAPRRRRGPLAASGLGGAIAWSRAWNSAMRRWRPITPATERSRDSRPEGVIS